MAKATISGRVAKFGNHGKSGRGQRFGQKFVRRFLVVDKEDEGGFGQAGEDLLLKSSLILNELQGN